MKCKIMYLMFIICSGVMSIATHDMSVEEQEEYKELSYAISHQFFLSHPWKNNSESGFNHLDVYGDLQELDDKPTEKIMNDTQQIADYLDQLEALFNKDRRVDESNIEQFHALIDNALRVNENLEIFNACLLGIKILLDVQLYSYTEAEAIYSINDILGRFETCDMDDKNSVTSNCKLLMHMARGACYKLLGNEEKTAENINISQQYAGCEDVKVMCLGSHIASLIS